MSSSYSGWSLWPLGGERRVRRQFAEWCDVGPGHEVVSLGCGSGAAERAIRARVPDAGILVVDPAGGRLARARRFRANQGIEFRQADLDDTGLPAAGFDRVAIVLTLGGMPPGARPAVLGEARRLCRPDGRVVVIDRAIPVRPVSRLLQACWWAGRGGSDEQALDRELRESGLEVLTRFVGALGWFKGLVARPARIGASWTPQEIYRRYRPRGRLEHDRLLLPLEAARDFVRDCRVHELAAVTVEGFFFAEEGVLSTTGMVRDFRGMAAAEWGEFRERVNAHARLFLSQPDPRSGLFLSILPWTRADWDRYRRAD